MPSGRQWTCLVIALGCLSGAARADEEANWVRLRSMSREQRLVLAENLKRFDSLPREEQLAIRKLQERIAQLEPSEQERYLAVVRRYHLWLQGLPAAERERVAQVARGPVAQRVELIHELHDRGPSQVRRPGPMLLQAIDLSRHPLYELAQALKVWPMLSSGEQARLANNPQFLEKAAAHLAAKKRVTLAEHPTREELDEIVKRHEKQQAERKQKKAPYPFLNGLRKAERAKYNAALNAYFLRHPAAVEPEKLLQFESSFPPWARVMLDPLPPEEARRHLQILYRLIYGTGEMPDPKKEAGPKQAVTPSSSAPRPPAPPNAPPPIPF